MPQPHCTKKGDPPGGHGHSRDTTLRTRPLQCYDLQPHLLLVLLQYYRPNRLFTKWVRCTENQNNEHLYPLPSLRKRSSPRRCSGCPSPCPSLVPPPSDVTVILSLGLSLPSFPLGFYCIYLSKYCMQCSVLEVCEPYTNRTLYIL